MEFNPVQIASTARDLSKIAKEPVEVQQLGSAIYAYGSELATLRIFAKYNSNGAIYNKKVRCGYSENQNKFYFVIEI